MAACFYPPQPPVWIEERLVEQLADLMDRTCPAAAEHSRAMEKAFLSGDAERLMAEHARLFVGPGRVIAPPYGSVYLEEGRRVMGDSTLDALQAYREVGLRLDPDFKDLPDHIAVELEFLYFLTASALKAEASGQDREAARLRAARAAFLGRHLQRWVSAFCARIGEAAQEPFYRKLAGCLTAFLAHPPPDPSRLPD
jgi:TorA maturation chaperone TorD